MAENVNSTDKPEEVARRRAGVEMPQELESRFVRVGNKLYRSAHDKSPVATISPDRIKARDASALPDLVRLAKANGWTSLKINGDADFKRAAYLAASAQGLTIDGYKPDAKTLAAAERDQARQPSTSPSRNNSRHAEAPGNAVANKGTVNQVRDNKEKPERTQDLAERFRRQSHTENANDPGLRRAQSYVAQAMTIASSRFPQDTKQQKAFVEQRKEEVAGRIERGERIAGVQVRQQQDERIRAIQQNQILQRQRTPSGR